MSTKDTWPVPPRKITNTREEDLYPTWRNICNRCHNPDREDYHLYGAKGVTVCDEWRYDFYAFKEDMGPRPSKQHSVDRIDVRGPYATWNCRWATTFEQASNRSDNVYLFYEGEKFCMEEACRRKGTSKNAIYWRMKAKGESFQQAFENVRPRHAA